MLQVVNLFTFLCIKIFYFFIISVRYVLFKANIIIFYHILLTFCQAVCSRKFSFEKLEKILWQSGVFINKLITWLICLKVARTGLFETAEDCLTKYCKLATVNSAYTLNKILCSD
jgi:hypothetical protein